MNVASETDSDKDQTADLSPPQDSHPETTNAEATGRTQEAPRSGISPPRQGSGEVPSSEQIQLQVQMQIGDLSSSLFSRYLKTFARSFGGPQQIPPKTMDEFRRELRQQATTEVLNNWTLNPPTYRVAPGESFTCDAAGCETTETNILLL